MDHFVDNWRLHRERLVSAVQAHATMVNQSVEAYQKTDHNLADALDPDQHGSAGAGRSPRGNAR